MMATPLPHVVPMHSIMSCTLLVMSELLQVIVLFAVADWHHPGGHGHICGFRGLELRHGFLFHHDHNIGK